MMGAVLVARRLEELTLIELNRPEKLNALTRELIEGLSQALVDAGRNDSVRGVVIAGAGPSFCAGVDLHEFAEGTEDSGRALITALATLCRSARTLPKPVACAIHGHCLGAALELAVSCDFRVAAPDAHLGMPEVFGGIPSVIDAAMLEHHVGTGRAHELLLTGDSISGDTAYQWGLVNRLAPEEGVVNTAVELVRLASRHDPDVVAEQKRLHEEWLNMPYTNAVESSIEYLVNAFRTGRAQRIGAARLRRNSTERYEAEPL
jgi:enoyl-CoA hydratase/carnithine racemase